MTLSCHSNPYDYVYNILSLLSQYDTREKSCVTGMSSGLVRQAISQDTVAQASNFKRYVEFKSILTDL